MSTKKTRLVDLREHLFEQMEKLKDAGENTEQEIRRAEAMAKVSTQIINSAKVQLQFVNALGADRAPTLTEQTKAFFHSEPESEKGLHTGKQLGPPQSIRKAGA